MKEKSIIIILFASILVLLSTFLNVILVQERLAFSVSIENCPESQDLSTELEEIDSEEYYGFYKSKPSLIANTLLQHFYRNKQFVEKFTSDLITPPPKR
jgi:hypothetical protein